MDILVRKQFGEKLSVSKVEDYFDQFEHSLQVVYLCCEVGFKLVEEHSKLRQ